MTRRSGAIFGGVYSPVMVSRGYTISNPRVRPMYSCPRNTCFFRTVSNESPALNLTRKSMLFWSAGFHLYTVVHVLPLRSDSGATGEARGVKMRPSVSYSNLVVSIVLIASSIAGPSPARNILVSTLSGRPGIITKSRRRSDTNSWAHPRRDFIGLARISSSVVKSGRRVWSPPRKEYTSKMQKRFSSSMYSPSTTSFT